MKVYRIVLSVGVLVTAGCPTNRKIGSPADYADLSICRLTQISSPVVRGRIRSIGSSQTLKVRDGLLADVTPISIAVSQVIKGQTANSDVEALLEGTVAQDGSSSVGRVATGTDGSVFFLAQTEFGLYVRPRQGLYQPSDGGLASPVESSPVDNTSFDSQLELGMSAEPCPEAAWVQPYDGGALPADSGP